VIAIRYAETASDVDAAAALFREYETWHTDKQCFVGFERELAALPFPYVAPDGALFVAATEETDAAGCVALARVRPGVGEMRRLYVRPAFRGRGIGGRLVEAVVAAAESLGCGVLRLQTLPSMEDALRLYRHMGFTPIPAPENAMSGRIYLELPLPASRRPIARIVA